MLNANAKAFVPGGVTPQGSATVPGVTPSAPIEPSLFRYLLSSPPDRVVSVEEPPRSLSVLQKLLSKRQLQSASKGGAGILASHQFVAEFFGTLANNPTSASGFVLSREILSLSAIDAVQEASTRDGFLLHLSDVSSVIGAETGSALAPHWESLMNQYGQDFRVTMIGYFSVLVVDGSTENVGENSRFLHYFFVCTTPKKTQLVQLEAASFSSVTKSVCELSPAVPRVFSSALSCALVVNITSSTLENKVTIEVALNSDPKSTIEQLLIIQKKLEELASKSQIDQSEVVVINISNVCEETLSRLPFIDLLHIIGHFCDSVMGAIVGIVATEDQWRLKQISRGLPDAWRFDPSLRLADILSARCIFCPRGLRIPCGGFAFPVNALQYLSLVKEIPTDLSSSTAGALLTRKILASHVDSIAKEQFKVRRCSTGVPISVVVDENGKLFCVDSLLGNALSLPTCWSNCLAAPPSCIFRATLVASYRGDRQYRILIHDVLKFQGKDLRDSTFSQRWSALDSLGLDDETCWPHGSPSGVVLLKSFYSQLSQSEQLLSDATIDSPSCGLQIVCTSKPIGDTSLNFRWIQSESLTARFVVDEIETVGTSEGHLIKRAYLSCRDNESGALIVFNENEYCDYHAHAASELEEGSLVECMLRKNPSDSGHWWDLLQVFAPSEAGIEANTESEIEAMIGSPVLTVEDLRWLIKAGNYLCTRCNRVNDVGKISPTLKSYQCRPCWEETGHGDCINCNSTYAAGGVDQVSGRFYCESCWNTFLTPMQIQSWAPPPPPDATFSKIVSTRVISLFIDRAACKGSNTDVLELCCGGSVVRKWINAGVSSYVGIDISETVVEETLGVIKASNAGPSSPTTSNNGASTKLKMFDVLQGDAFDPLTWTQRLSQIHPTQFHTITCFGGLQRAFSSEKRARDALFAISNALVPNGLFLGSIWSANALLRKGCEYENSAFRCSWDDNPSPRIGSRYTLEFQGEPNSESNGGESALDEALEENFQSYVVPLDFLVAVASEYKLELVREFTFTFSDLLADDDRWTRPLSADEKELFGMRMTFGFRKTHHRETVAKQ